MEVVNNGAVHSDIGSVLNRWGNDFENLLNCGVNCSGEIPDFTPPHTAKEDAESMNDVILLDEVQAAIRSL